MSDRPLTPKQRRFVDAYLMTWNANKAARLAGYSGSSVHASAYLLLRKPVIKAAIDERMKAMGMAADEVLARLTQQARANPADFFCFEEKKKIVNGKPVFDEHGQPVMELVMTGIHWDAVAQYGYLVKKLSYDRKGRPVLEFHDPQHALELLAKRHGLLIDRSELSGPGGGPVEVDADVNDVMRRLLSDDAPGREEAPTQQTDEK